MFIKELFSIFNNKPTLVRLIIVAVKNNGGYKYGGIAEKLQNLTRHN